DRVAVMMPTSAEFLYAWFGILGAGAIEVPIHDAARGPGIAYILETTGARVLIVYEEHVAHVAGHIDSVEQVIVRGDAGDLVALDFASLMANPVAAPVARHPGDPASILFTGGTTGPPNDLLLPHNHNLNLAQGVV